MTDNENMNTMTRLFLLHDKRTDEESFFESGAQAAKAIGCTNANISQRIKQSIKAGHAKAVPMLMLSAKKIDLDFKDFELTVLQVPAIDFIEEYIECEDNLKLREENESKAK